MRKSRLCIINKRKLIESVSKNEQLDSKETKKKVNFGSIAIITRQATINI